MKHRMGFVSNSSSTSFVLMKDGITPAQFEARIQELWDQAVCDGEAEEMGVVANVARFIAPKEMSVLDAKRWIKEEYSKECWGADEKISERKRGSETYLSQALKAKVFGITEDNALPYMVLEHLREEFGEALIIHHLG